MKREPDVVYQSIAETHLSNILISVVDDNPSDYEATQRLLRSLGFTVEPFSSAAEFLRSPRLEDTSCLILDVHMPGITGFQLQSLLIAGGHSIPTIFISSTGMTSAALWRCARGRSNSCLSHSTTKRCSRQFA